MKKILQILAIATLAFTSCTPQVVELEDVLEVSHEVLEYSSDGQSLRLTIESRCPWAISSSADWAKPLEESGPSGLSSVVIEVSPNETPYERTTEVVVYNEYYNIARKVQVKQEASEPTLEVCESVSFSRDGETKPIDVISNLEWVASCKADWVTLNRDKSQLVITVTANKLVEERRAEVVLKCEEFNIETKFDVVQDAFNPELYFSNDKVEYTADGGSKSIEIFTNFDWTASCEADWITLSKQNKQLTIAVAENRKVQQRSTIIKVTSKDYDIAREIEVTQAAFAPTLESNVDLIELGYECDKTISVTSNISWKIVCDAPWVKLSVAEGEGNQKVAISATINTTSSRSAVVKLINEEYDIVKEIKLTQYVFIPTISLRILDLDSSSSAIQLSSSEKTYDVKFSSNFPWKLSCDADWVTTSVKEGGPKTVTYSTVTIMYRSIKLAENDTETERTAKLTFTSEKYEYSQTIFISQDGKNSNIITYTSTDGKVVTP